MILLTTTYANNQKEMQNNLTNIKIELEKIKIIQKYENKDLKIKEIELSIKNLENRLNSSQLNNNTIENNFQKYDEIIKRQDARISDLNASINNDITLYTSMIAILFIIISIGSYTASSNENENFVKAWLDEKADEVFEPKVDEYLQQLKDESNTVLKQIEQEASKLNQEHKEMIDKIGSKPDNYSNKQRDKIYKDVKRLGNNSDLYNSNDWYSKYLQKYLEKDFEKALVYVEKALDKATTETELAMSLYGKCITLEALDRREESLGEYDKLINKFSTSETKNGLEIVAFALKDKIEILLIDNKDIEKELELVNKLFSSDTKKMIKFSMLEILYKAQKENQDKAVADWMQEYKDITLDNFGFSELDEWNETIEDEEIKLRVKNYIDEFKKRLA